MQTVGLTAINNTLRTSRRRGFYDGGFYDLFTSMPEDGLTWFNLKELDLRFRVEA